MALARRRLDWAKQIELSVDSERASEYRRRRPPVADPSTCSMCSKFCVLKLVQEILSKKAT
jgi:phosphomethylpyrimidine synthase